MGVSQVLKIRRKELNYTLLDIAKKIGVSEATVQRWESGNIKNLRYDKIVALADILEISPAYLMGWEKINDNDRSKISSFMNQLNAEGQEKVLDYASDLVASGKYKKHSEPGMGQKEA